MLAESMPLEIQNMQCLYNMEPNRNSKEGEGLWKEEGERAARVTAILHGQQRLLSFDVA